jgi:hypothetical protein
MYSCLMVRVAGAILLQQLPVPADERLVACLGCQRASLLCGGDGLGEAASLSVSGGERADHDRPSRLRQCACLFGQANSFHTIAEAGFGTGCQYPGQVVQDLR